MWASVQAAVDSGFGVIMPHELGRANKQTSSIVQNKQNLSPKIEIFNIFCLRTSTSLIAKKKKKKKKK